MLSVRKETLPPGRDGTADTLRRMASFVRQSDAHRIVKATAAELVKDFNPGDLRGQAERVFYWVRDSLRYVRDIRGVEEITAPWTILESLRSGGFSHSSDCDDHSILLAALLRSIGFATRFVAVASGRNALNLDHVRAEVLLSGYWFPMEATIKGASFGRGVASVVEPVVYEMESGVVTGIGQVTGDEPITRYTAQVESDRLIAEVRAKQAADLIAAGKAAAEQEAERARQYATYQERLRVEAEARAKAEAQAKLASQAEREYKSRMAELSDFAQAKESEWKSLVVMPIMRFMQFLQSYPVMTSEAEEVTGAVMTKAFDWSSPGGGGGVWEWNRVHAERTAQQKAHFIRFPSIFFKDWLNATAVYADKYGLSAAQLQALQEYFGSYIPETTYYYFYQNAVNNDIFLDLDTRLSAYLAEVTRKVDTLDSVVSQISSLSSSIGVDKAEIAATISQYAMQAVMTKVPVFAAVTGVINAVLGSREQVSTGTPAIVSTLNAMMSHAVGILQGFRTDIPKMMDSVKAKVAEYEGMVFDTDAPLYGLSEENAKQVIAWIGQNMTNRLDDFSTRLEQQSNRVQAILSRLA